MRNRWRPNINIEDAERSMGRDSMRVERKFYGSDQLERTLEAIREDMEAEAYAELCGDCGQPMRLHFLEDSAFLFTPKYGSPRPIRYVICPEPIPASDAQGGEQ